jgi:simple sugar transport system ATP-binding protein
VASALAVPGLFEKGPTLMTTPSAPAGSRLGTSVRMVAVSKRFGDVRALRAASLEVRRGEIHGLLGENGAGKTTLMNVLYGLLQPDEGTIEIDERPARVGSPRDAIELGIGMVHQHFMLVPDMTVAENVGLGQRSNRPPLSVVPQARTRIGELSSRYRLGVRADDVIETLPVGLQQRVELLKILYREAEVLILDEPTAVLTPIEWQELAGILRALAAEGRTIILITHKLEEILEVADRCTVLRDGERIGTVDARQATKATLAKMMVGREVVFRVERPQVELGPPVLEAKGLGLVGTNGRGLLAELDFEVRAGEILGVAGVDGNGQDELVEVLTGMRPPTGGRVLIGGRDATATTPERFVHQGGAVIPADRHRTAVALDLSVMENLLMREYRQPRYLRRGLLRRGAMVERATELLREYDIRAGGVEAPIRQLSGGNQQKAVLARELSRSPRLLIAAQPTRGLDVGAIEQVYARLLAHKRAGGATLLISSELEELLSLSDRIAVMVGGRFLRILDPAATDLETLGLLMGGEGRRGGEG